MKAIGLFQDSLGDLLFTLPMLTLLSKMHGSVICICNEHYTCIFDNNPFIVAIATQDVENLGLATIDIDWIYEQIGGAYRYWRTSSATPNLYRCAFQVAIEKGYFSKRNLPRNCPRPQIYLSEEEKDWAKMTLPDPNYILVDLGTKQKRQEFETDEWNDLFNGLRQQGQKVLIIGQSGSIEKHGTELLSDLDLREKTTMREFFALMDRANYFLGVEGGALQVANAFDKKGVFLASVTPACALLSFKSRIKEVRAAPITHGHCHINPDDRELLEKILKETPMPIKGILDAFSVLTNS